MAELVKARAFRKDGLLKVIDSVLKNGEGVAPRGQMTTEVRGFTLELEDPTDSLLSRYERPNFSPGIAVAEAAQLIGGISDPALMGRVSPNFLRFRNGGTLLGAYGPRLRTQLPQLENRLREDETSRQALVTIWDPMSDLWSDGVFDLPCTVMFQFFVRNDRLDMQTYMRSNDVWWGLCYDVFQFTQLQMVLATAMGLSVGRYVHTAGSMHIYHRDLEAVKAVREGPAALQPFDFTGDIGGTMNEDGSIRGAMQWFEKLIVWAGGGPELVTSSVDEEFYAQTLEKYRV